MRGEPVDRSGLPPSDGSRRRPEIPAGPVRPHPPARHPGPWAVLVATLLAVFGLLPRSRISALTSPAAEPIAGPAQDIEGGAPPCLPPSESMTAPPP